MVYVTAIHMSSTIGPSGHEHIERARWQNPETGATGTSSRAEMVRFINEGGVVKVQDDYGNEISVGIVNADPPFIRTFADRTWTDNLLALPRF